MALSPEDELHQQWLAAMTGGMGADPIGVVPMDPIVPPPPQQITAVPVVNEAAPPMPGPMPVDDQALHDEWLAAMTAQQQPAPAPPAIPAAAPEQEPVKTFDPMAPDTWAATAPAEAPPSEPGAPAEQSLTTEEYLRLDPLSRAKYDFEQDQQAQQLANDKLAEIQRTDQARAAENEREYMAAQDRARQITEAALADSEALANEKPKKFTDSIGNVISGIAAIFLGQFGAAATGGKNMGMEMLVRRMDQFADDQQRELARRGANVDRRLNIAARLADAGYNQYQAKTVIRMAGLQRAREQLATEMQNYDPRGTTARRLGQHLLQVNGQLAKSAADLERQAVDDETKKAALAKARLEVLEKTQKLRGVGGTGAASPEKAQYTPQQLAQMFPGQEVPPAGWIGTKRDYDQWLSTRGKGEELATKRRGNVQFEGEQERQLAVRGPDGGFLLGDDDKPVKMKDTAEAKDLTQSIEDTDAAIRMIDEVLRLRAKHGWSSNLLKSDEWQQMQQRWGKLILKTKSIEKLGAITESDMDLVGKALGAKDPTQFIDPTPGISSNRRSSVADLHTKLRVRGVGEKYMPQYPETWKNQAPEASAVDEAISDVLKADKLVDDRGDVPIGPTGAPAGITKEAYEAFKQQTGQLRDRVRFLEDAARTGGDKGRKARQGLVELSNKAASPIMREAAAQALRNLEISAAATQEEVK